jgi:hypothetical protein
LEEEVVIRMGHLVTSRVDFGAISVVGDGWLCVVVRLAAAVARSQPLVAFVWRRLELGWLHLLISTVWVRFRV